MKIHKVTIDITEKELDALENYFTTDCWSDIDRYDKERKPSLSVW